MASILFSLALIYGIFVNLVKQNLDISSLYYEATIKDQYDILVRYAIIGLFFVFALFVIEDMQLNYKLFLRSVMISFLLLFMVFSGEFSALTNHYPVLSIFSIFANLVYIAAVLTFLLLLFWDNQPIKSGKFWGSWLLIGMSLPFFALVLAYLGYFITQIVGIQLYADFFPNFGDANAAAYLTMFALIVLYIEIRILSLIRSNPSTNVLKEYDFVQLVYSNSLNILIETIAVICTSLAAIWSISVFIFDQPIDQSEVPVDFVHLTFLLTIPFSLLLSRGRNQNQVKDSIATNI